MAEDPPTKKKVLISMLTIGHEGILAIWLRKFKRLQELGCEMALYGGIFCEKIDLAGEKVYDFNQTNPEIQKIKKIRWTKWKYLAHSLKRNAYALFTFRKYLKEEYDVIYSPSSALDLVIFPYFYKKIRKDVKWVTVFDNIVPFSDPGNKLIRFLAWFFFEISLFLLRKADKIFAISDDLREYLLKKGFSEGKIVLSTNGVENDLIKKAEVDEKYNIDALFLGRINETKGIYDMLEVLNIVRGKYPDFQLVIMGEGDETTKNQFKRRIKNMDLENNVQFLGFRTGQEKFNIIKSAKCFWFLSVSGSESFGIALLEAVCSGIPAFAYDLPQFPQIYNNREVDISPKGDYELVAQKVMKLFENGNFTNGKGKMLLDKYSWEHVAEIEYNVIKSL